MNKETAIWVLNSLRTEENKEKRNYRIELLMRALQHEIGLEKVEVILSSLKEEKP